MAGRNDCSRFLTGMMQHPVYMLCSTLQGQLQPCLFHLKKVGFVKVNFQSRAVPAFRLSSTWQTEGARIIVKWVRSIGVMHVQAESVKLRVTTIGKWWQETGQVLRSFLVYHAVSMAPLLRA